MEFDFVYYLEIANLQRLKIVLIGKFMLGSVRIQMNLNIPHHISTTQSDHCELSIELTYPCIDKILGANRIPLTWYPSAYVSHPKVFNLDGP